MNSREAILARIREANRRVESEREALARLRPTAPSEAFDAWEYGRPTAMPDVLGRFVERVEDYRAVVVRVPEPDIAEAIGRALGDHGADSVVVPSGIPTPWLSTLPGTVRVHHDDPPLSHTELDTTSAVVTDSAVGIAETGTIVLDHGSGQGRRALSLVPDLHICLVRADQVVSDVPEAVARLAEAVRAGRPLTWISGPSATSDIELSRVEGVHGPRTLHVILVDSP
ncbi:LutC/YkgG family protein [Nostocoides australiense]|nr:lactate utilization protein C [Actinomycetota bacterium]